MMQSNDVRWVALGDYIEPCDERNVSRHNYPMLGINKNKEFMPTVANVSAVDISKYKIVKNGLFVFSGMQTGRDVCIRIALYEDDSPALISPAYTTFVIKGEDLIHEYLFMYFDREEMDRFGWFISDSSVRSNLDWNRFIEIQIPLPAIEQQREMVAAWKGLREMKEENERIAEPLESLCRSYLQDLKYKYPLQAIGPYIEPCDERNTDKCSYNVLGINKDKTFMPTVANIESVDLKKYKVVRNGYFVFSGMQTGRDICIRIALYNESTPALISPAYTTFTIKEGTIIPEYLFMYFKRVEMDRLGWFISDSSVRSNLDWNRFLEIEIPMPPIEIQQAIVDIYRCADESRKIATEANALSTSICPALMQKVING